LFPNGYPNGYSKWQTWAKSVNADYPIGTFSAAEYLTDGNLGAVSKRTLWCINVYSFNASEACAQIEYIASLPGQPTPRVVLELGKYPPPPTLPHSRAFESTAPSLLLTPPHFFHPVSPLFHPV